MVQRQELVALVGKRAAGLGEVALHLLGAVVDLSGADQLVAGMLEGVEGRVELLAVLRVHVLAHDLLPLAPQRGVRRHRYLPITRRSRPREMVSGWLAAVSSRPVRLAGSRAMPSCCRTVAVS